MSRTFNALRSALRRPTLVALLILLVASTGTVTGLAHAAPSSSVPGTSAFLGYNASFRETGLPFGTTWSVTVNSVTVSGATRTLTVPEVPNGTASYTIGAITGYSSFPSSGSLTVAGGNPTAVAISFAQTPGHYTVSFTETGLAFGVTSWNVTFNGTVYAANGLSFAGPTISIAGVVNGTYTFSVAPQYGLFPAPSVGSITVNGANPTAQNINFGLAPGHYTVTFGETGLSIYATSWNVTFNGTLYAANGLSFAGPTISIANVVNGTYTFSVAPQYGMAPTPITGQIIVNGANPATQTIAFGPFPGHYSVAFSETGLPRGSVWHLTFNGSVYAATVALFGATVITINSVVNGTYFWNTTAPGFSATPPSGSVTVNGASPATTTIVFTAIPGQYSVTFRERGLPAGTASWSVTFNNTSQQGAVPFPPIVYSGVLNGTYLFSVPNDDGCVPSPAGGTLTVAGAAVTQTITFTCPLPGSWPVWFNETGLAPGLTWSVTFNAATTTSTASSIEFFSLNGGYPFTVGAPTRWVASPASGTVTVNGASISTSILFVNTANRFNTTFTETGLPAGTNWGVTYNGTLQFSRTTSIVFLGMINGTFAFNVSAVGSRVPTPVSGSSTVQGADTSEAIVFNMTYTATFSQTGLPSTTSWSVDVGSTHVSGNTASLVFPDLVNHTYTFSVGAVSGYTSTPPTGTFSVAGSSVTVAISFRVAVHTQYTVAFTESGLPNGTSWSVTFNGTTASGTGGSAITFQAYNASGLAYSVGTVSGYTASPSSGTVNVQGQTVNVPTIQFSKSTSAKSGLTSALSGPSLYILLVVVVVILALLAAFLILRRRRSSAPPKSPETAEGAAAAEGAGGAASWASTPEEPPADSPAPSSDGPAADSSPPSSDGPEASSSAPSTSGEPDSDGQPALPTPAKAPE